MRKIGLIVIEFAMLSSPLFAQTQQQGPWSVQFTIFPGLNLIGDELMGYKYYAYAHKYEAKKDNTPPDSTLINYTVTYKPIVAYMPEVLSYATNISFTINPWRLGLVVWNYHGSGEDNDVVTTPPEIEHVDGSRTLFINGVSLIGRYALPPVLNDYEESRLSPVPYGVYNSLNLQTYKAYAAYALLEKLDLRFGIKTIKIKNTQKKWQGYTAYLKTAYWVEFHNEITLAQTAKAQYRITGPSIGFTFSDTLFNNFAHLTATIDGALLSTGKKGKISYTAQWTDTDSITLISAGTGELKELILLDGNFPFSLDRTATVPNIEINLGIHTDIYRTQKFTARIGLEFFKSVFFGAPIAPTYEVPGMWSWIGSSRWELQKRDLEFQALSLTLTILF